MNLIQLTGAVEIGLIYGLIAIAVYLTFRIIDFPDLTVDGSFPMGAAITASMIVAGFNPLLATTCSFLGGMAAGSITAYLNTRWNILGLLAGILTMTGLYSINLRIMGRPNIALLNETSLFSAFPSTFLILIPLLFLVLGILIYFLNTQIGLAIRACGQNHKVARAQGVRVNRMILLTLAISNGLVAVAGSIFAQAYGYADITLGPGTIIVGLASVIIGEALFPTRSITILLCACVLGSIIYRIAVAFALNAGDIGLQASDLKLITAILIAATMILPKLKKSTA